MTTEMLERRVQDLALESSHATDCRVLIETDRRTILDRDIVELRVYLRGLHGTLTTDRWTWLYRQELGLALDLAGLELAVNEWFVPSQRFPSCGCWVMRPTVKFPVGKRLNVI